MERHSNVIYLRRLCSVDHPSYQQNHHHNENKAGPQLEAAKVYIDKIDFTNIINKLISKHKWLKIEAMQTCQFYRNYLFLVKKYGNQSPLAPPAQVKTFWQQHILDTKKYTEDCLNIFGEYFHYPDEYNNEKTHKYFQDALSRTSHYYQQEFNQKPTPTRYYCRALLRLLRL